MFRITNKQTRSQSSVPNRDELLAEVNDASALAEARQERVMLYLEQVAEDGSILDQIELRLPLLSIVEDALATFGVKRDKKGFLSRKPSKTPKGTKDSEMPLERDMTTGQLTQTAQEQAPLEANPQKGDKASLSMVWKLMMGASLLLSLAGLFGSYHSWTSLNQLSERLTLQENQGKVEVVGRYFISHYFSGDSKSLSVFLSKDLAAEGLEAKTNQTAQSIIFESAKSSKGLVLATFVLMIREADDQVRTARLTLAFKPDKRSVYQYVLDEQPKFSSFGE